MAVVGTTGSGKTTVARRIADVTGLPHLELDALHWGPGWAEPTADEFRAKVDAALAESGWIVDGNYGRKLGGFVVEQADLVVWLDAPLRAIVARLWFRTLRRIRSREELWSGNRETWRGALFARDSPLVWALRTHRARRRSYEEYLKRFNTVRLRSPRDVDAWLAQFGGQ